VCACEYVAKGEGRNGEKGRVGCCVTEPGGKEREKGEEEKRRGRWVAGRDVRVLREEEGREEGKEKKKKMKKKERPVCERGGERKRKKMDKVRWGTHGTS
jgi:hypothetical protein